MDNKKRVLFVEDIDSMRESYLANLRRANYRADGAANLSEAIEAIDLCTYHVAIVDIMLNGPRDTSNRDGLEVLKYVQSLGEGTQTIVLSAVEKDSQLVSDSYAEYGVSRFVLKSRVQEKGIEFLLGAIKDLLAKSPLNDPLTWHQLVKSIAWPVGEAILVSECLRLLQFKGGAENLLNSLLATCQPLMPLLPHKGAKRALSFDETDHVFRGNFWSKGQGAGVELLIWGKNVAHDIGLDLAGRSILENREKAGLSISVTKLTDISRSDFLTK